jgi:hypothetical protein
MGFFAELWKFLGFVEESKPLFIEDEEKMEREVYHVVRNPEGGWFIKQENIKEPVAEAGNKRDAIGMAKKFAKRAKLGQVIIHKMDGRIQREYTYGKDPRSTKG